MKKNILLTAFILFVNTISSQIITFDDQGLANGQSLGNPYSISNNGEIFKFTLSGGGTTDHFYRTSESFCGNSGFGHIYAGNFAQTTWTIETASGNEIDLGTISFDNVFTCFSFSYNLTIEGFKNNNSTGSQTFTVSGLNSVFNSNSNFNDVDKIVITCADLGNLGIDNINWVAVVSNTPPTVTTTSANLISETSATLAGNVTADGGDAVTERGFVFSKTVDNNNPLISGTSVTKITDGNGTGLFSEPITNLAAGTQYSFKAYATNSVGTSYGAVNTFTTTGKGWTGAVDTNWANANNWSPNSVPISTDNLVIPNVTNKPIINSTTGAVANTITVDSNSSLTIENGGSLILEGLATINGDFIYNVAVTDDKWHLISSPVKDEQYNDAWNTANNVAVNLPNEAVATYTNTTDANGDWQYYQHNISGSITFDTGIGYSLKRTSAGNYNFVGTFPTAPVNSTISVNDIGGANENRWNLVGNPFPAYINIDDFLTANTTPLTDTHESIYVWNPNSGIDGEYQPITTGYIPPGQGFFLNSNVASTSIGFTKAMQSNQTGVTFYKTSNPKIVVKISQNANSTTTEINYLAGKTTGLDPRFDIGTFTGQSSNFKVFTHLVSESEGVDFAIQALPNSNYQNMIVPLGLYVAANKEISISTETLNLPTGIRVFLEDKETNTFTDISQTNSKYIFTTKEALRGVGRFFLHTKSSVLNVDEFTNQQINTYKLNSNTIRITGATINKTNFQLFNTLGKQVFNTSFIADGEKDISLPKLANGIYIVQVKNDKQTLNKKIIIE